MAEARTLEEQLAEVEKAIEAVETKGQRYAIKDRELYRADLKTLYSERDRLRQAVSRRAGRSRVRRIISTKGL